jgi:diguanylate cyclase (GGDEF)-like protein
MEDRNKEFENRFDLKAAISRLKSSKLNDSTSDYFANAQAVKQFNYYLKIAKIRYPSQPDLVPIDNLLESSTEKLINLKDSIGRLEDVLINLLDDDKISNVQLSQKFGILRSLNQLTKDFHNHHSEPGGIGIIFFDIDHFKSFNSKYTETVVDEYLLIPVQMFLSKFINARGFCYSVGGDEFIILLRNVDKCETNAFADRLVKKIREEKFIINEQEENITISAGFSTYPVDSNDLESIKKNANEAENYAKKNGRNQAISWPILE